MRDRIPRQEIEKWLSKLRMELKEVKARNKKGEELLMNIQAYVHDTMYFLKEGNYVKAWEAVSFAWGLFEASVDIGVLVKE